jgi:hypothetical protein
LQLQYLCSFRLDSDMKKSLGRLPPDLHDLYAEIYEMISTQPGEDQVRVFKNVLDWLLCAQATLKSNEFLCAVSMDPQSGNIISVVSKELVLEICSNFVVFDAQLDTFRFAHLSVREFLEKRAEYNNETTNALAAEVCLWTILSTSSHFATQELRTQLGWQASIPQASFETFCRYADIYWAQHCKLAKEERNTGRLKKALEHLLLGIGDVSSGIALWNDRLKRQYTRMPLSDTIAAWKAGIFTGLLVACAFDLEELAKVIVDESCQSVQCTNRMGRNPLLVAVRHGSCASLTVLLKLDRQYIQITEEVVEAAAGNYSSGEQVMTLLLDRRGADIQITEKAVAAIVRRFPPYIIDVRRMADVLLAARGQDPPPQPVGKNWVSRFIQSQPELQTKWTRKFNSQRAQCEDPAVIAAWFKLVAETRQTYGVLDQDIYNFDETGFAMGVAATSKVVTSSDRVGRAVTIQPGNREWVTAIECINASGWCLPLFVILSGKAHLTSLLHYVITRVLHDVPAMLFGYLIWVL